MRSTWNDPIRVEPPISVRPFGLSIDAGQTPGLAVYTAGRPAFWMGRLNAAGSVSSFTQRFFNSTPARCGEDHGCDGPTAIQSVCHRGWVRPRTLSTAPKGVSAPPDSCDPRTNHLERLVGPALKVTTNASVMLRWLTEIWLGEKPLWQVAVLFVPISGVIILALPWALVLLGVPTDEHVIFGWLTLLLAFLVWSVVSLWRSARYSPPRICYPARVLTLLVLIVLPVLYSIAIPQMHDTRRAKVQEAANYSNPARTALRIACSVRRPPR